MSEKAEEVESLAILPQHSRPCRIEMFDQGTDQASALLVTSLLINGMDIGPWVDPDHVVIHPAGTHDTAYIDIRIRPTELIIRHLHEGEELPT